ncbi:MAG: helix-turn-helix transcriptional regulator [Pseudobdellovibrio sp.]
MTIKKSLGEKLAMLAKSQEKSQTDIAEAIGMAASQLNRFFKGHSELSSHNLMSVLSELGIDLDDIISKKTRKYADIDEAKVEDKYDCLTYMFRNIDELGQQTYLKQLAWATKTITKKPLPLKVQEIIKKETHLI